MKHALVLILIEISIFIGITLEELVLLDAVDTTEATSHFQNQSLKT